MATYKDVQDWVKKYRGFVPKTCWIAHCKELNGLSVRTQYKGKRVHPCPANKRQAIEDAFRFFKII